jgi:hypothetical protein
MGFARDSTNAILKKNTKAAVQILDNYADLERSLLWPGYFAGMQNELCKTTNFVWHFPIC